MKKHFLMLTAIALAVLTSCNNTLPNPEQVKINPSPMAVVGDKVNVDITGTFPEKKFAKKGVLVVTPVLKYGDKELLSDPVTYVGEKAKENGTQVNYKEGGTYRQHATFAYNGAMDKNTKLYLRFNAKVGNKEIELPDMLIAEGLNSTAKNVSARDNKPQVTADKFQRVIQQMQEADILFLIQQATLRNSETTSQQMKDLQAAIKEANSNERKAIHSLEVAGYASPDGAQALNEKLAKNRQDVAQKFLAKDLKKNKINQAIESNITAEDWEGFKAALENSNIQDKELVLRVLSMYNDPEERETQIKNIAAAYKNIADEILPALRRSRLILTTDLIGKSDDEIKALAKNDPAALTVEELLYAATLTNDNAEKIRIYKKVTELYSGDYRGFNNLGMAYMNEGNVAEARRCFQSALQIEPNNPDVNYNAGVAAMADGDLKKAEEYLGKAAGTQANLAAAMGTLYTMKGDYKSARGAYGQSATNNAAVQQILSEDYAAAKKTLDAVAEPNATTAYLKAVVGARTNNRADVLSNLKNAVAKDANMKAKAANDVEFAKFAEDAEFLAIIK
ncbi:MAG: tetratricopeptide repeat protein [Paludibacteraceae bacterium]|nr:tetratricopeptide repeat protein [Paludibacteraceae bacterium]